MRYIDADKLKENFPKDSDWEYPVNTNKYVCEIIDMQPVIEVIRCRDCENWDTEWEPKGGGHYCGMIDSTTSEVFYCAFGEKRENK